jgi:hypothetical protein
MKERWEIDDFEPRKMSMMSLDHIIRDKTRADIKKEGKKF